jgi:hypothetical protein
MAPIECRAQRLVARKGCAASAGQQRKAIAQARGYLLNAEYGCASGGKFDCERYAIKVPADRGNRWKGFDL